MGPCVELHLGDDPIETLERFRQLWAAQGVRQHTTGTKVLHHPVVGVLELTYESLVVTADTGLRINTYVAAPGSSSADGLRMLAAWAATREAEDEQALAESRAAAE